ncbi:single-stranded DNA-binding protein [bacterium]|nr:MAG: single-stranded DNA-binding protein [bacterium]
MNLNKAMIIGRLTKDPDGRTTPSGRPVTSFSVATNRVWSDASGAKQEATEYHNVVLWGKLAEISAQYLVKGQEVYVEGRLQTRSWEGQDGVKRYSTEIVADTMQMGSKARGSSGSFQRNENTAKPESPVTNQFQDNTGNTGSVGTATADNPDEIKIENIPF